MSDDQVVHESSIGAEETSAPPAEEGGNSGYHQRRRRERGGGSSPVPPTTSTTSTCSSLIDDVGTGKENGGIGRCNDGDYDGAGATAAEEAEAAALSSSNGPLAVDLYSHSLLSQSPGKYFDFRVPATSPPRRVRGGTAFSLPPQQQQHQNNRQQQQQRVGGDSNSGGNDNGNGGGGAVLSQSAGAQTYCDAYELRRQAYGLMGNDGSRPEDDDDPRRWQRRQQQQQQQQQETPQTSNLAILLERQSRGGSEEDCSDDRGDGGCAAPAEEPSLGALSSSLPSPFSVGLERIRTPTDAEAKAAAETTFKLAAAEIAAARASSDGGERDDDGNDNAAQHTKQQHPRDKERSPGPGRPLLTRQPHTYSPGDDGPPQPRYAQQQPQQQPQQQRTAFSTLPPVLPPPPALGSSAPSSSILHRRRTTDPRTGSSLEGIGVLLAPHPSSSSVPASVAAAAVAAGSYHVVPHGTSLSAANGMGGGARRSSAGDVAAGPLGPRSRGRAHSVDPSAMLGQDDAVRRCVSSKEISHVMPPAPLSSSPYTHMLYQKERLEATFQQRLMAARQSSMKSLVAHVHPQSSATTGSDNSSSHETNGSSSGKARQQQQQLTPMSSNAGDDSTHSSVSARSSSSNNANAQQQQQQQQRQENRQRMTNETRKCRRAEHNRAVIDDLCEIVADLFLAESKLLNPQITAERQLPSHHLADGSPDRDAVLSTVTTFLSDLPVRYALGVDSPSEVLVHMRLLAAARADSTRAAVHIANVDGRDVHATSTSSSSSFGRTLRLVTISCADCDGLLEFITKLLGTGGARVVDADVMLTSDNITLDRFVVEMKGRLRLDKLQQYIESYLRESRNKKEDEEDKDAEKSKPKSAVSAPILSRLGSQESIRSRSAYGPLYFHPPKGHDDSSQERLEQEIQSAVPLSEVISSSSPGNVRSQSPGGRYFRQQQASALRIPPRSASQEDDTAPDGRVVAGEDSASSPQGQSTSENCHEAPPSPPATLRETVESDGGARNRRRHVLVNRDATDFSSAEYGNAALPEGEGLSDDQAQALAATRPHRVVPVIPFEELMLIETLGSGRVSTIYRAAWQHSPVAGHPHGFSGTSVAMVALKVATIDPATGDASNIEELRREADIAAMLDHNNICSLVGVASDPECFCLAYDFCEGGSLLSLLSDTSRCYEYLPIALDIANGMAYLHSRNVIHRDLKPSNVLLTRDNRAKIADFGMSVANTGQELTAETGTYRWMAPEVIRHESYSSNADVYSFGIVLWQLITREVPFATMSPVQTAYAVAEGHRPEIPDTTPEHLRRIVCACWDEDSQKRPSFTYIAMALADYAKMAFNPANVGAQTVRIANDMLANVQGNSTVNVDFSTPVSIGNDHRKQFSHGNIQSRNDSSPRGGNWFFQPQGPSSFSSGGNIGLEI